MIMTTKKVRRAMRKKIIAGNWKMNKGSLEARDFASEMVTKVDGSAADVVFCVPFVSIHSALEAAKGTTVAIGAQNMHF